MRFFMGCNEFNFLTGTCTQVDVGFDFDKVLTYTDSAGLAIDVTGFDFTLIIKDTLAGSTLLTLPIVGDNTTTGLYIPDPTNGIINMHITDTDSTAVGVGLFPYEMTETDGDLKVDIFIQGNIQFSDRGF